MANFNHTERRAANILSSYPKLKSVIKKGYQYINYLLYRRPYNVKSSKDISRIESSDREKTFFGYYDKSPLSTDGCNIAFHASRRNTKKKPSASDSIFIDVYDLEKKTVKKIGETSSYNWQQGARLQWLSESKLIYNFFDETYKARIVNIKSDKHKIIDYPVYDCYKEEYSLTLNFQRLDALSPDYGYRNLARMDDEELKDEQNDGIFYIDLNTGKRKLIISLSQLKQITPDSEMEKALQSVNHIMISPDGQKFMFIHRYFVGLRRYDRLFVSERDGSNLKLLASDEMVSHCCWWNKDEIVGYLRDYNLGDKYFKINASTGYKSIVGEGVINEFGDGHPSILGTKVVFDTYPNKSRMKRLYSYDTVTNELEQIGEFFESLKYYGETRCDLHPRLSDGSGKIFFDSVHEGKRKLYFVEI